MPFRPSFSCLWCGAPHVARGPDDVEGWAQLCPSCVGKAGENGFLRFRLRQALAERGVAARDRVTRPAATADEIDDRYLRRGRFARGPIHDAAWNAELDAAGQWLDALPIQGEIVELAAGTGWWSTLLADKGTLSAYDANPALLDRARERLVAHRLRAHLHVRELWAEPDRQVDALFVGLGMGSVGDDQLEAFARLARRWLKPGGVLAAIDLLPDPSASPADEEPYHAHASEVVRTALLAAGFAAAQVAATGRFLLLVHGTA